MSLAPLRSPTRRRPASCAHADQLGPLCTHLEGRPAPMAYTLNLRGGAETAKLAKAVAAASGRTWWWHGRSGRPERSLTYPASLRALRPYRGHSRSDGWSRGSRYWPGRMCAASLVMSRGGAAASVLVVRW